MAVSQRQVSDPTHALATDISRALAGSAAPPNTPRAAADSATVAVRAATFTATPAHTHHPAHLPTYPLTCHSPATPWQVGRVHATTAADNTVAPSGVVPAAVAPAAVAPAAVAHVRAGAFALQSTCAVTAGAAAGAGLPLTTDAPVPTAPIVTVRAATAPAPAACAHRPTHLPYRIRYARS
jgi:hypothetical protein